jgi:hypothetical protein
MGVIKISATKTKKTNTLERLVETNNDVRRVVNFIGEIYFKRNHYMRSPSKIEKVCSSIADALDSCNGRYSPEQVKEALDYGINPNYLKEVSPVIYELMKPIVKEGVREIHTLRLSGKMERISDEINNAPGILDPCEELSRNAGLTWIRYMLNRVDGNSSLRTNDLVVKGTEESVDIYLKILENRYTPKGIAVSKVRG